MHRLHHRPGEDHAIRRRPADARLEFSTGRQPDPRRGNLPPGGPYRWWSSETWFRLGSVCIQLGKLDESVPYFREALRLNPGEPEVHTGLARALKRLGKLQEAVASFQRAVLLNPDSPATQNGLAAALAELGRLEEAIAGFRQAVRLKPDFAEAHSNLGFALRNLGRLDEALAALQLAIQLKPNAALAHNNLGITLVDLGRLDEAIASFQQSVRLQPDFADAHKNLGIALLLSGNLEQGWPEYEWRWKTKAFASRLGSLTRPRWDGSPLSGRTILLCAEQGLGDSIQFVRYASRVKQSGATVFLECQASLVSLLGRCAGVDQVVSKGSPRPPFDVYAPLMSLPFVFKTSLASIPAPIPYVSADSGASRTGSASSAHCAVSRWALSGREARHLKPIASARLRSRSLLRWRISKAFTW